MAKINWLKALGIAADSMGKEYDKAQERKIRKQQLERQLKMDEREDRKYDYETKPVEGLVSDPSITGASMDDKMTLLGVRVVGLHAATIVGLGISPFSLICLWSPNFRF